MLDNSEKIKELLKLRNMERVLQITREEDGKARVLDFWLEMKAPNNFKVRFKNYLNSKLVNTEMICSGSKSRCIKEIRRQLSKKLATDYIVLENNLKD